MSIKLPQTTASRGLRLCICPTTFSGLGLSLFYARQGSRLTSVIAPAIIAALWCDASMGLSLNGCCQSRWDRTLDRVPKTLL